MGSVLRSFGAFQGNVYFVAPFIPVETAENQWKNTKNEISPEQPNRTGQKSKSVSPNTPSNIIQLRANGTFGRQCARSGEGWLAPMLLEFRILNSSCFSLKEVSLVRRFFKWFVFELSILSINGEKIGWNQKMAVSHNLGHLLAF